MKAEPHSLTLKDNNQLTTSGKEKNFFVEKLEEGNCVANLKIKTARKKSDFDQAIKYLINQ